MSNFQPFEVVDRGSETLLQMAENLNKLSSIRVKALQYFYINQEIKGLFPI